MEQAITPPSTKGVIIGLVIIVYSLVIYFLDVPNTSSFQWISYLLYLAGIIWAIVSFGKQIDHNATFGKYFSHGFKTSAIVTIIMILFMILFVMVFPEIKEKGLEEARKAMDQQDQLSAEQKKQALEMSKKFFTPFLIGGTMFYYILLGAIASLIGAGVARKDPRPDIENI